MFQLLIDLAEVGPTIASQIKDAITSIEAAKTTADRITAALAALSKISATLETFAKGLS